MCSVESTYCTEFDKRRFTLDTDSIVKVESECHLTGSCMLKVRPILGRSVSQIETDFSLCVQPCHFIVCSLNVLC